MHVAGSMLVLSGARGRLVLYGIHRNTKLVECDTTDPKAITRFASSADKPTLLAASSEDRIYILSLPQLSVQHKLLTAGGGCVRDMHTDGQRLVVMSGATISLNVYDIQSGKLMRHIEMTSCGMAAVCWRSNRVFVDNYWDGSGETLSVLDFNEEGKELEQVVQWDIKSPVDGMAVDPKTSDLYVFTYLPDEVHRLRMPSCQIQARKAMNSRSGPRYIFCQPTTMMLVVSAGGDVHSLDKKTLEELPGLKLPFKPFRATAMTRSTLFTMGIGHQLNVFEFAPCFF